ncbi:MAG: hypothetical protein ACYCX4_16810 [Bacillota bacterium]
MVAGEKVSAAIEEIDRYLASLVKSRAIQLNIERKIRAKLEEVKKAFEKG